LLNSDCESIELTSDKYETFLSLKKYAINQIPSYSLDELPCIEAERIVVKAKDGVGCEDLYLIEKFQKNTIIDLIEHDKKSEYFTQPYIDGQHASLSLICWQGDCLLLTANKQQIEKVNGTLELRECIVNSLSRSLFLEFSKSLISQLPGLKGYVGVDLLIVDKEIYLVEVNPRLTTSYVGLRTALNINPASLILQTFMQKKLPIVKEFGEQHVVIKVGEDCAA